MIIPTQCLNLLVKFQYSTSQEKVREEEWRRARRARRVEKIKIKIKIRRVERIRARIVERIRIRARRAERIRVKRIKVELEVKEVKNKNFI